MTTKFISDMGPKSALIAPRPFTLSIYVMVIQDLAKRAMIGNAIWPSYPYIVKTIHLKDFFSRTIGPIWLIFCVKHMGHLLYKKAYAT